MRAATMQYDERVGWAGNGGRVGERWEGGEQWEGGQ